MRQLSVILFIIGLFLLAACGGNDVSTEENEADGEATQTDESVDEGETNGEQGTQSEKTTDETDVEEEEKGPSKEPTDALGIINATAEAMSQVSGMALEGEIMSRMEMSGIVTMDETNEITGEVSLDPYTEHLNYQTTSELAGGTEESEYYMVDQVTYAFMPSEGWTIVPMGPDNFGSAITESQYKTFSEHHDQFELSEDGENYVLTFEGGGDIYKEVIYGGLKDTLGEEVFELITSIIEGTSGSYQFTVDKQTFHVMSSSHESEMIDGEISMDMSVSFEYSKHNEVDKVVVPEDVIENAKPMEDMAPVDDQ